MEEAEGIIFDLKRYAVNDGPGLRITVFMKGCPLRCAWCHNPESQSMVPEAIIKEQKVGNRTFRRNETVGRKYTVSTLMAEIDKEWIFMEESGGGVTFSGGEPLMQPGFLEAALKACKERGYHTAVDTCGYASASVFQQIAPFTDLFLFDIKHTDPNRFQEQTGGQLQPVLSALHLLGKLKKKVIIRFPLIPGYNDDAKTLSEVRTLMEQENLSELHVLPFHTIGHGKYPRLERNNPMAETAPPTAELTARVVAHFQEAGIKVKVGG